MICENCGGSFEINGNKEILICPYCGAEVKNKQANDYEYKEIECSIEEKNEVVERFNCFCYDLVSSNEMTNGVLKLLFERKTNFPNKHEIEKIEKEYEQWDDLPNSDKIKKAFGFIDYNKHMGKSALATSILLYAFGLLFFVLFFVIDYSMLFIIFGILFVGGGVGLTFVFKKHQKNINISKSFLYESFENAENNKRQLLEKAKSLIKE